MSTLRTFDRALKMIYAAPNLKSERYLAASALRRAVHEVLRFDRMLESPRTRGAAKRWRPRAVRRRRAARAKYRSVRAKYRSVRAAWERATPEQRKRGGMADAVLRPSAVFDLFKGPPAQPFRMEMR